MKKVVTRLSKFCGSALKNIFIVLVKNIYFYSTKRNAQKKVADRIIKAVLHVTGHNGTQLHCVVFYLRKETISFVMSVRLSTPNNPAPNRSAFITFSFQSQNNESYFT
jgi:hypothetical protein